MKRTVLTASLVLVNFFLVSCALLPDIWDFVEKHQRMPVGKQETIVLTRADDGKKIDVRDGTYIQITLPVNPGAGDRWERLDGPGAARVVVRVGEPAYVPGNPSGSGGQVTFRFQALGLGIDTLKMELRRDGEVVDTFAITIESLYAK